MMKELILSSTPLANYTFRESQNIIDVEMKMNRYTDLDIIRAFLDDIEKVPKGDQGYFLLINFLEIGQTNAKVRQLVHERINVGMNSVALVTSPLLVGPMSLFINLFRPKNVEVKLFSKRDEAKQWLFSRMESSSQRAS